MCQAIQELVVKQVCYSFLPIYEAHIYKRCRDLPPSSNLLVSKSITAQASLASSLPWELRSRGLYSFIQLKFVIAVLIKVMELSAIELPSHALINRYQRMW